MQLPSRVEKVLNKLYNAIFFVCVDANEVEIVYEADGKQDIGKKFDWDKYLSGYCDFLPDSQRSQAKAQFSTKGLKEQYKHGKNKFSLYYPYAKDDTTKWMTVTAMTEKEAGGSLTAYVLFANSDQDHLLRSIIDMYVYSSCDYFICIDAKNDSYTIFGGDGSEIPIPSEGNCKYSEEVIRYNRAYVAPEDQERSIYEMSTQRVLEQLEHNEVHTFTLGLIEPNGYRRKRIEYRYYDRERKMLLFTRTDITASYMEHQKHLQELKAALLKAQTDMLTGIFNYYGIVEHISAKLKQTQKMSALIFFDMDNFKSINDRYGHQKGDELLCEVADILKAIAPEDGCVGRVGGDEFIVFLPNIEPDQAAACAEAICHSVNKLSVKEKSFRTVSCSIGISLSPRDGTDYKSLVRAADRLAYESKRRGKNCYTVKE